MRSLLDVNVLIALLDANHVHHRLCTRWLESRLADGWASCPITQNGCIRIMSQPGYPNPVSAAEVADRLHEATRDAGHAFWPDSISLLGPHRIDWPRLLSGRHLTDAYLVALSAANGGCFATLDQSVPLRAVIGAGDEHVVVIA
jgi:uncharacterized protein